MTITRKTQTYPSDGSTEKLSFTAGPFQGIIFSYGAVRFIEERDRLLIKFDYKIHSDKPDDFHEPGFRSELADHLDELLRHGLINNSLVYTGGT
jgi:hypothetical protein